MISFKLFVYYIRNPATKSQTKFLQLSTGSNYINLHLIISSEFRIILFNKSSKINYSKINPIAIKLFCFVYRLYNKDHQ